MPGTPETVFSGLGFYRHNHSRQNIQKFSQKKLAIDGRHARGTRGWLLAFPCVQRSVECVRLYSRFSPNTYIEQSLNKHTNIGNQCNMARPLAVDDNPLNLCSTNLHLNTGCPALEQQGIAHHTTLLMAIAATGHLGGLSKPECSQWNANDIIEKRPKTDFAWILNKYAWKYQ